MHKKLVYRPLSRFNHSPTLAYNQVVDSILNSTDDFDDVQRAIAEGTQNGLMQEFFNKYKTQNIKDVGCMSNPISWLRGKRAIRNAVGEEHLPNGMDHTYLYEVKTEDKTIRLLITQPYAFCGMDGEQLLELITWCDKNKLELTISPQSWHFYGKTLLVVIKAKES
jgi:hypothetical protein